MSLWWLAEESRWRLTASVVDMLQSTRYWGALPRRHRWTVTPSLNWMRWGTSSQWSSEWSRCVKPWSNLWVPLTTRAAVFSTRWRRSAVAFDDPASMALQPSTRDETKACTNVLQTQCQVNDGSFESDEASRSMLSLCVKRACQCWGPMKWWHRGGARDRCLWCDG